MLIDRLPELITSLKANMWALLLKLDLSTCRIFPERSLVV